MRSMQPIPGNPWPHDMSIAIEDEPHALLDLLWVREAWGLRPDGDSVPYLVDAPPAATGSISDGIRGLWEGEWMAIWNAALQHAGKGHGHEAHELLRTTADGSPERREMLAQIIGPTWRARFGDSAFTAEYDTWVRARFDAHVAEQPRPLEETPERRSLDALIRAWSAGLANVVTLPCRGNLRMRVGPNAMLLSEQVRDEPARYSAALEWFAAS